MFCKSKWLSGSMNALLYFENGVYEILLRRTEEQDHNNLFKVKILLHPNVKRFCKLQTCFVRNKSKISPFALFYVDFGPFFAGVFGVVRLLFIIRVQIFGDFPEFLRA